MTFPFLEKGNQIMKQKGQEEELPSALKKVPSSKLVREEFQHEKTGRTV